MRRIVYILLTIIVLIGITGCNSKSETETQPITLTSENFEDYFLITAHVSNFREDRQDSLFGTIYDGYADLIVEIRPKKEITTDNVTVKVFINISGYKWLSKAVTLTLDVNGNAEHQEAMSLTGQLISISTPGIDTYSDEDVEEGQFLTSDRKFIVYELTGSIIEE